MSRLLDLGRIVGIVNCFANMAANDGREFSFAVQPGDHLSVYLSTKDRTKKANIVVSMAVISAGDQTLVLGARRYYNILLKKLGEC